MESFKHILIRCLVLLLFGVLLHCGYRGKLVWELWNVLCQLSFTILVAFLVFKFPFRVQLLISFGLLLLTEILFRYTGIEGFDKPFVKGENFGSFMDMVLMGKLSGGGWLAINAIPTSAHTIWGVLAGKILQTQKSAMDKYWRLLIPGVIFLALGYSMDWTNSHHQKDLYFLIRDRKRWMVFGWPGTLLLDFGHKGLPEMGTGIRGCRHEPDFYIHVRQYGWLAMV